jgi:para-aminobenzoate synthetase/4-amino-4-deoxychorismate lyase
VYNVGGGITWDSAAGDEYAEAIQKAACLTPHRAAGLIETMRVEGDTLVRLDRHIARMRASAAFLGIPFDERALRYAFFECGASVRRSPDSRLRQNGPLRLRLQLAADGEVAVACTLMDPTPSDPIVVLATSPVRSADRRLCHKTTDRRVYERQAAAHPGAWDVLLWNERDELTEFTRGNVVLEIKGRRLTPSRESGLLNGVFRQELLDSGEIAEAVLTKADLARATQVWFINSLREWVAVTMCPLPSGLVP